MQFRVELRYFRPSGTETSAYYTVEALSASSAIKLAKQLACSHATRKIASWGKCTTSVIEKRPSFVPPAPIQDGEQITLSITGTVELGKGDIVVLRGGNGYRLPMSRSVVERKTGRPLAPPPPVVTVEYYSLYPNQYCYGSTRPVQSSQYGLDQLVQVRVTKHDGKIVDKQIV